MLGETVINLTDAEMEALFLSARLGNQADFPKLKALSMLNMGGYREYNVIPSELNALSKTAYTTCVLLL